MNRSVTTIVCRGNDDNVGFSLSISDNGKVYSMGRFPRDLFLPESEYNYNLSEVATYLKNIKEIDCGLQHTMCLDTNGSVFSFGRNTYGQLGVGRDENTVSYTSKVFGALKNWFFEEDGIVKQTDVPLKLNLPPIKQIRCGMCFTVCVTCDGNLYTFGFNNNGQLGTEPKLSRSFPKEIDSLRNVDFVECGGEFVISKTLDNNVYVWGANKHGQLGTGDTESKMFPFKLESFKESIADIKCGMNHTLILTNNQEIFSCGSNQFGKLGRDTGENDYSSSFIKIPSLSEIRRIGCGDEHSVCINVFKDFFVFGSNLYGQLGLSDTKYIEEPTTHPSLSNVIDVSCRGFHSFVKTANNEIYAFGYNKFSQLGIETEHPNKSTPIQVLQGKEEFWRTNLGKSNAKSARN